MLDVVIIGSGFGGSIVASRLAGRGKTVVLLERGPWRDSAPVRALGIADRAPFPYGRHLFRYALRTIHFPWGPRCGFTLSREGFFELFRTPGIDVLCTSNVGGGSHAYTAMLTRPRSTGYWHGHHSSLRPAEVERYYDRVLAEMEAAPFSGELAPENSIWTQLAGTQFERCAPATEQPAVALRLGEQRCDDAGVFGSRRGTKPSVDTVYLPDAISRGLEVRDRCEVDSIARVVEEGVSRFRVRYRDGRSGETIEVGAKTVVLAAGAINSLRLLFVSREGGGLQGMPALGSRFGGNGDCVGLWHRPSSAADPFDATPSLGRFAVDSAEAPYMVMFGLPGIDALPLPSWLRTQLRDWVPVVGMGADSGEGSVTYKNGRLRIDYNGDAEQVFDDIRSVFGTLEIESGTDIRSFKKPITVHQWGGAHLGQDDRHGVIDHTGEVFGHPGLFVADGSALPAAVGTPPSLTIGAWAHHVADCVIEKEYARGDAVGRQHARP